MTIKLHIGGEQAREGWTLLNIQPKRGVDLVASADNLSALADQSVGDIYASHVYEHLDYAAGLPAALREAWRVLAPGGRLMISVPDLDVLCRLMLSDQLSDSDKFTVMRTMFGGQTDPHDLHRSGLNLRILGNLLYSLGFRQIRRVQAFGLFDDCSTAQLFGHPISLNVIAERPREELKRTGDRAGA